MTSLFVSSSLFAAVLAVDIGDLAVPIVVFVVWVINQIAAAKKAADARQPRRPAQPPAAGGGANNPAAGGPQPAGRGGLLDEVEQFMRQARQAMEDAQKRPNRPANPQTAQPQGGNRPQASQQKSQQQQRAQQQRQAQAKQPNRGGKQQAKKSQPPASRKPLAEQPRLQTKSTDRSLGGSVAAHVEQHLDTSRFDERAGRLSHLKQTVDDDIGAHVHASLDHQLGRYAAQAAPTTETDASPDVMTDLIDMISSPQNMRAAFLMQVILARPTARWK